MYIDLYQSGNLATLILTFIAGLLIAKLIKSKGIGGCLINLIALVVLIIIGTALWQGYSVFIERISFNLESYLSYNLTGLIGGLVGFILGLLLFNRKKE